MLEDFLRDPFFAEPFPGLFGRSSDATPNLFEPPQEAMSWPAVPQPRGRGVKIQFSGASQPESQPRFSIEEVHDDEHTQGSGHSPVVEEPEEGNATRAQQSSGMRQPRPRPQPRSTALQLPFQSFFDNSSFGDSLLSNSSPFGHFSALGHRSPFGNIDSLFGNMDSVFGNANAFGSMGNLFGNNGASRSSGNGSNVVYSSSSFAQQGPDGVQYSKSHSSSYGPQGVTEHQMRTKDGRTGLEEMTISRHIGDKGRTVTKWRQADGTQSEQQSLHNITDNEASSFDQKWTNEAERSLPMYRQNRSAALPQASRSSRRPEIGYRS